MTDNELSTTPMEPAKRIAPTFIADGQNSSSSVGGALAVVFVFVMHQKGVDFPAGMEVSIGAIAAVLAGYFHDFAMLLLDRLRR